MGQARRVEVGGSILEYGRSLRQARAGTTAIAIALLIRQPDVARAQTTPSLDARTWQPSGDPRAGLVLEPTMTPGPGAWNLGVWWNYAQSPMVLRDAGSGTVVARPLEHLLGADVAAGVGIGDRVWVGIDAPFFLWEDGTGSLPAGVVSGGAVPSSGVGDVALYGKATLVSNDRQGVRAGVGLAARAAVTLPVGDRASFMGDGAATSSLVLLSEYALGVGAIRGSLGYKVRTDWHTWPTVGGVTFGDEIPWSVGFVVRPKALSPAMDAEDRQEWEVALHGSLPGGPVAPFGIGDRGASTLSPVMLAVGDRIALGRTGDTFLVWGGDFGLDDAAGVPAFRAILSFGWAPRTHDRDNDGVPDDVDECPELAEDRDGIQDNDGCPEDDADGDGVPDASDACPLLEGPPNDDPKKNGCPAESTGGSGK